MLEAFHITWLTHNSRVSDRMVRYRGCRGPAVILSAEEEIEITSYIRDIVVEDQIIILAYNICRNHVHLLLICRKKERDNVVRKLKGKTTQLYKNARGIKTELHLWAQKYGCQDIEDEDYLYGVVHYIRHNREKHGLSSLHKGLQPLVREFTTTLSCGLNLLWLQ